ncbi:MAG: hypothetical protein ABR987_08405 [Terracidiphilus sp.]|jgi:hypothetical protein
MRRSLIFLVLTAALAARAVSAQEPTPKATAETCLSTATLDLLIAAIDAAVSGPADKDRTCFRALFLPDARLIPIRIAADGTASPVVLNVDGWISAVAKRGSQVLTERQIKVKTETWAHLAHLWSTYTTSIGSEDKPADRGINSIQAVFDGKQWHVIEIVWQAEKPDDPVPAKYLP